MSVSDSLNWDDLDLERFIVDVGSLEQMDPDSDVIKILQGSGDVQTCKENLGKELKVIETKLVSGYLDNCDSLLSLYKETEHCESILVSMEKTLSGFAGSLRGVSDDIRQLQQRSEELSLQLKSRSDTQERLIGFMDSVVVSPDLVRVVCEEEDCGSDKFLSAIEQLKKNIRAHEGLPQDLPAVGESGPELHKLKVKAVSRVRDFLGLKINALKQPRTNIQILQRNVLVNLRPLTRFLKEIDNGIFFNEVYNLYAATLSKLYSNQFKIYVQTLMTKLQLEATASKQDLIGTLETQLVETGSSSDLLSKLKLSAPLPTKGNVFSITGREQVVKQDLDAEAIVVVTEAPANGLKYYPETLLRSHQKLLADTASSEYLFVMDFFHLESPEQQRAMFEAVFGKTLLWFSDHIASSLVKDSFDPVGLLLALRILEHFRSLMSDKRKISVMNEYFDSLLGQLRQRLRLAIDLNTDSLKKIEVKKIPTLAFTSPFYVSRRFAEFTAAILFVKSDLSDELDHALLSQSLESMTSAFDSFLMNLSKRFTSPQEQQVFLINNVDLVVMIFKERQLAPILPLVRRFEEKFNSLVSVLIEQVLMQHFGPLIKTTLEQEKQGRGIALAECERLVVQFQQTWKQEIGKTQKELFSLFSNLATASEILKNAMTQLLLYYTRFQKIVNAQISSLPSGAPSWTRQLVPGAVIMAEIKQVQNLF